MPATGYTRLQIRLHWIIAVLIVLQFVLHDGIHDALRLSRRGDVIPVATALLANLHVIMGIVVFALVIWRLRLRTVLGVPSAPEQESPLLRRVAALTHAVLYLLMLLMPLSGMLAWFGGIAFASSLHEAGKVLMIAFVLLHVLGALYQTVILKSGVMQRMRRSID